MTAGARSGHFLPETGGMEIALQSVVTSALWQRWIGGALTGVLCATALASAQAGFEDTRAIIEFQRAADSYAFTHRQIERQLLRADELPAALRAARFAAHQSVVFFTPAVQAVFRSRIARALRSRECEAALYNRAKLEGQAACVTDVLPRLPDELEYVVFGRALLLVDRHVRIVVDVFPEALTPPDTIW